MRFAFLVFAVCALLVRPVHAATPSNVVLPGAATGQASGVAACSGGGGLSSVPNLQGMADSIFASDGAPAQLNDTLDFESAAASLQAQIAASNATLPSSSIKFIQEIPAPNSFGDYILKVQVDPSYMWGPDDLNNVSTFLGYQPSEIPNKCVIRLDAQLDTNKGTNFGYFYAGNASNVNLAQSVLYSNTGGPAFPSISFTPMAVCDIPAAMPCGLNAIIYRVGSNKYAVPLQHQLSCPPPPASFKGMTAPEWHPNYCKAYETRQDAMGDTKKTCMSSVAAKYDFWYLDLAVKYGGDGAGSCAYQGGGYSHYSAGAPPVWADFYYNNTPWGYMGTPVVAGFPPPNTPDYSGIGAPKACFNRKDTNLPCPGP